jgi:hypothetical protein
MRGFVVRPRRYRLWARWTRPEGPKTRSSRRCSLSRMFFWAVVSDEINRVIEFFPTRWQAERMLAKVLWVEPAWQGILRVEKIEFRTGTAN